MSNIPSTSGDAPGGPPKTGFAILDWIEKIGNKLPEPAILFAILAGIIVVVSAIGSAAGWSVQPVRPKLQMLAVTDAAGAPVLDSAGKPKMKVVVDDKGKPVVVLEKSGGPIEPRSLLTQDGIYWMFSSMLRNFTSLPALGLVFVAMLGIGLAEKFNFFSALMRWLAMLTPKVLLTPVIVLIGANSSVASDAGYIILPPLAAALYMAMGRSPIAGLAAAFAGVAGGFGGGFFPTGGDAALTGFAQEAARIIDSGYTVDILHNGYFKAGSAIVVMLAGWLVTDYIVEPRLRKAKDSSGAEEASAVTESMTLNAQERKGLVLALAAMAIVLGSFAALVLIPGSPLSGRGVPRLASDLVPATTAVTVTKEADEVAKLPPERVLWKAEPVKQDDGTMKPSDFAVSAVGKPNMTEVPGAKWSHVIVPMIFLTFLIPGMVYGWVTGSMRSQKDFIEGIYHGIRSIVPVLAIAFFMAQFVNYFSYTRLDRMLAYAGGSLLVEADMPIPVLLTLFILVVVFGDFALSGMLSKFGVMAPIFIPMFMMVGMSPELTTAAYRIGDSVVNIITPLNSYLLIILAVLQKYKKQAGLGSLISLMLPYSVVFFLVWTAFLLVWYWLGLPLGPAAPAGYLPPT
jgi:aminobenzoyl-glutamate transport protein